MQTKRKMSTFDRVLYNLETIKRINDVNKAKRESRSKKK